MGDSRTIMGDSRMVYCICPSIVPSFAKTMETPKAEEGAEEDRGDAKGGVKGDAGSGGRERRSEVA